MNIDVWVPGKPRTKGSMRIVNGRRNVLTESVEGSVRWRQLVAYTIRSDGPRPAPIAGPVGVILDFYLPVEPTAVRSGDIDKLTRNILDALSSCTEGCESGCRSHAGVYVDDVQVVSQQCAKYGPAINVGVRVQAFAMEPESESRG